MVGDQLVEYLSYTLAASLCVVQPIAYNHITSHFQFYRRRIYAGEAYLELQDFGPLWGPVLPPCIASHAPLVTDCSPSTVQLSDTFVNNAARQQH